MANGIIHGDSIHAVAYALYLDCLSGNGRLDNATNRVVRATEADLLRLYARCRALVDGIDDRVVHLTIQNESQDGAGDDGDAGGAELAPGT